MAISLFLGLFSLILSYPIRAVLRNHIPIPDENFLKVHPDLAALYEEVQEKENALKQLNLEKKVLKEEIRAVKNELKKRLAVIDAWQSKVEAPAKKGQRMR